MTTDYYANKALSHSKLSCLAQNPMEFKMRYVDDPPTLPPKESDAFAFGGSLRLMTTQSQAGSQCPAVFRSNGDAMIFAIG